MGIAAPYIEQAPARTHTRSIDLICSHVERRAGRIPMAGDPLVIVDGGLWGRRNSSGIKFGVAICGDGEILTGKYQQHGHHRARISRTHGVSPIPTMGP
jgi:hypothetical protein